MTGRVERKPAVIVGGAIVLAATAAGGWFGANIANRPPATTSAMTEETQEQIDAGALAREAGEVVRDVAAESTTTTTEPEQLDDATVDYFMAVAEYSYRHSSGLAQPASLADLYGTFQTEVARADPSFDYVYYAEHASVIDVTADSLTVRTAVPGEEQTDITYSDIETSSWGVVSFAVDGEPLAARWSKSAGPVAADGITIDSAALYRAASGSRFAMVTITNDSATPFEILNDSSFVASNGLQDEALYHFGSYAIQPAGAGITFFEFDEDPPDSTGTLHITGYTDDFTKEYKLSIDLQ